MKQTITIKIIWKDDVYAVYYFITVRAQSQQKKGKSIGIKMNLQNGNQIFTVYLHVNKL